MIVLCSRNSQKKSPRRHDPLESLRLGAAGLASKGLQLFLPISPEICVLVYDPSTYEYGSTRRRACTAGVNDVKLLNALQAVNAKSCIYFDPSRTSDCELARLQNIRKEHADVRRVRVDEGRMRRQEDGSTRQLMIFGSTPLRLGRQLHFVRIIDHNAYRSYDGAGLPIRSPELLAMAKEFKQLIEDQVSRDSSPAGVTTRPSEE